MQINYISLADAFADSILNNTVLCEEKDQNRYIAKSKDKLTSADVKVSSFWSLNNLEANFEGYSKNLTPEAKDKLLKAFAKLRPEVKSFSWVLERLFSFFEAFWNTIRWKTCASTTRKVADLVQKLQMFKIKIIQEEHQEEIKVAQETSFFSLFSNLPSISNFASSRRSKVSIVSSPTLTGSPSQNPSPEDSPISPDSPSSTIVAPFHPKMESAFKAVDKELVDGMAHFFENIKPFIVEWKPSGKNQFELTLDKSYRAIHKHDNKKEIFWSKITKFTIEPMCIGIEGIYCGLNDKIKKLTKISIYNLNSAAIFKLDTDEEKIYFFDVADQTLKINNSWFFRKISSLYENTGSDKKTFAEYLAKFSKTPPKENKYPQNGFVPLLFAVKES